jgi:hypothetical protein
MGDRRVPTSARLNFREEAVAENALPSSPTTSGGVPAGAATPPKTGTVTASPATAEFV